MAQPATAGTNLQYTSVPNGTSAFVVNTVTGYQGVARPSSLRPDVDATSAPNSVQTAGGAQSVQVVNTLFCLSNPA